MGHRVFITGAAGYIGGMLCDLVSQRADVDRVIALDCAPMPDVLRGRSNIHWIAATTDDPSWSAAVAAERPDIVIHAAWQIRDLYGQPKIQRQRNIGGSERVFDFAFTTPSVQRLVHFSTVSAYGAQADNTTEHRFTEAAPFRATGFRYAEEKREAEANLERGFASAHAKGSTVTVAVLRPAAVTGPRGRSRRALVGLQAALSGQLKSSAIHRVVSLLTSVVPVTANWCRQFVHEDDVADIAMLAAFIRLKTGYEILNVAPPGEIVLVGDVAAAFGKRLLRIPPQLIRLAFFIAWHGTRGRIPTSRGTWKPYCYPLVVDGSKLTALYGYSYRAGSKAAFTQNIGRYAQ